MTAVELVQTAAAHVCPLEHAKTIDVFVKANYQNAEAARMEGVSQPGFLYRKRRAMRMATAGAFLVAAEDDSGDAFEALFSPEFRKADACRPDVVIKFDWLIKHNKDIDWKHHLSKLWDRCSQRLAQLANRAVWTPHEAYTAHLCCGTMMKCSRVGGNSFVPLWKETFQQLSKSGLWENRMVRRCLTAVFAFCGETGPYEQFRKEPDAELFEVEGSIVYSVCGFSDPSTADLAYGKLGIGKKIIDSLPTNKLILRCQHVRACARNPMYQRPALAWMVLTWAKGILESPNANGMPTKEITALREVLEQDRNALSTDLFTSRLATQVINLSANFTG